MIPPGIGSYMQIQSLAAMSHSAIVAAVTAHVPGFLRPHADVLALALTGVVLMISSLAVRRAVVLFRGLAGKHHHDPRSHHSSETELTEPAGRSL